MKKIIDLWRSSSLVVRILAGLIIGAVLGLFLPELTVISMLGTAFVGALKAIAPILVFVLVLSALANASANIGRRFRTVILLYMLSTFLAAICAVAASFLFPTTIDLEVAAADSTPPSGIGAVLIGLIESMVSNPVSALGEANYIAILFWAILFGVAMKKLASDGTKKIMADFSEVVSSAVRFVISFAPLGILGLVYEAVAESGLSIFADYGRLLLVLVGTMLTVSLIINPFIAFLCLHRNPYPLVFRCLRESGLTAFFTRSSAANIPVNMALCERLGLERDFYSVSVPLGATINMDGAAVTITIMTLAAAHTLGIHVDIPTAILLSFLATLGACGASGVAGGSLLLIPMACSLFGIGNDISMQVVAVGFIIGVVQDSIETALNSSGDVVFAATAEYRDRAKRGEDMRFLGEWSKDR